MKQRTALRRPLMTALSMVIIFGLAFWLIEDVLGSAQPGDGSPRLLNSGQDYLTLELVLPEFQVAEQDLDGLTCQTLSLPGFGEASQPGQPAIPSRGSMIGIPPGSQVSFEILRADLVTLPNRYNLCPVGQPVFETDLEGQMESQGMRFTPDPAVYSQDSFLPGSLFIIDPAGFIRSQQVAAVHFQPFQYNPLTGELGYYQRLQVRVNLSPASLPAGAQAGVNDEGAFEPLLQQSLVNYAQARSWRLQQGSPAELLIEGSAAPTGMDAQNPQFKISIDQDGIYQVTYAALLAAGFPVNTVDPRNITLAYQGEAVRVQIRGEEDGVFDSGDTILFYGQKPVSKYTETGVYWLSWGDAPGLRFTMQDGTPAGGSIPESFLTTHYLEEDHSYQSARPSGADRDHWYWNYLQALTVSVFTDYTFNIEDFSIEPHQAVVRGLLRSYSATPEHHTRIYLNGMLIDEAKWPLNSEYAFEVAVPQAYLLEGTNTLRVEAVLGSGTTKQTIYVNRFSVDYNDQFVAETDQLVFSYDTSGGYEFHLDGFSTDQLDILDITQPADVQVFSGWQTVGEAGSYQVQFQPQQSGVRRFLVTSAANWRTPLSIQLDQTDDLNSPTNGADYIIIARADFIPALQPLASHRAANGLRVKVVDLQDVYDVYSGGMVDPNAIHSFLANAYATWSAPAPSYVLLVGDGHYDFKDNFGFGEPVYMPPFLAEVDPWLGETASDNRYVTVSGEDILPDLFIGRLPVRSADEASSLVNKIIQYETQPLDGDWNEQLLFVADNADSGGDFPALSDATISASVPAQYQVDKIYYGITHTTIDGARAAIQAEINEGKLIVSYVGHAASYYWATEKLLTRDDISLLNNPTRLPFFVPMTCIEGYFINPSLTPLTTGSLAEVVVRASGRGAIASWSPAGMGIASGHDLLENSLLDSLLSENLVRLGPATTLAKYDLYSSSLLYRDLIDTYLLFGDPALILRTPDSHPTPTPTHTHTPTPTDTPTPTHTHTPTPTDTDTPTHTHTPTPTDTDTPTHTHTPTPTDTDTPTHTFTPTPTNPITLTLTKIYIPILIKTYTSTAIAAFSPTSNQDIHITGNVTSVNGTIITVTRP